MILAIETSTNICSVAFENEAEELFEKRTEVKGSHSEKLFLFIRALMQENDFEIDDLEAVLVSEGPGSYTGLRIAASGVKGLLFGTDVPLYGVSTLASFGVAALEIEPDLSRVHAIIDARRSHVYHQKFEVNDGIFIALKDVEPIEIQILEQQLGDQDILIGTGIKRFDVNIRRTLKTLGEDSISAKSLIELFHSDKTKNFIHETSPADFDPKYYR